MNNDQILIREANIVKYLRQFGIILAVTCVGEIMKYFIPLPIPGSIYGLILMFVLLLTKVIKVDHGERNRRVFNRDHAAYVYSCRSRADHFMESAAAFFGAAACDHSGIYVCSHDCNRKSNRFFNFKKRGEKVIWII